MKKSSHRSQMARVVHICAYLAGPEAENVETKLEKLTFLTLQSFQTNRNVNIPSSCKIVTKLEKLTILAFQC